MVTPKRICSSLTLARLFDVCLQHLASKNPTSGQSFVQILSGTIRGGAGRILVFHGGIAWIFG